MLQLKILSMEYVKLYFHFETVFKSGFHPVFKMDSSNSLLQVLSLWSKISCEKVFSREIAPI